MLFRWKGLRPAPNSAGWERGIRCPSRVFLQRRHAHSLLDEWERTTARARTRNACRPHAVASVAPYLEPRTTVYAMDRRGRGGSGDGEEYTLEREYEDVAAVVDAVAEASGSAVDVYGHSHGGICAFGGATLTFNIRKLVLYEGWPVPNPEVYALPAEVEQRMDALLATGELDAVVETLFRELESMSEEDLSALRAPPPGPDAWQPPPRSLASSVLNERPGWILSRRRRSPYQCSY